MSVRKVLVTTAFLCILFSILVVTQVYAVTPSFTVDAGSNAGVFRLIGSSIGEGGEAGAHIGDFWDTAANRLQDIGADQVRVDWILNGFPESIVSHDSNGNLVYNWRYLDEVVDRIVAQGAHPFLCISYMPVALSGDGTVIGLPKSMTEWNQFMQALVNHYKTRNPGAIQYWELWNEPNWWPFFRGTVNDYNNLYKTTVEAIKAADPTAKVGGPACSSPITLTEATSWMGSFLDFVKANNLPLDFISWHSYQADNIAQYGADVDLVKLWLNQRGMAIPELFMTEWNYYASYHENHDKNLNASYAMEVLNNVYSHGIDKLFFFELKDGKHNDRFFGGFGMLTYDNYPKPVYNAFKMYAKMPTATKLNVTFADPAVGVNSFASKDSNSVEIMVWNHNGTANSVTVNVNNLPFGTGNIQYNRYLVDGTTSNVQNSLTGAELTTVESQVLTARTSHTVNLTMNAYSVTKLVFKAAATTVPAAPTNVTATGEEQKIIIRWSPSNGAVSYTIRRATSQGGTYTDVAIGITGSVFVDATATAGINYYYKVQAVNATGTADSTETGPAAWFISPDAGNLVYNYSFSTSSFQNTSWGLNKVVDGSRNSVPSSFGWSSDPAYIDQVYTESVIIDLGGLKNVDHVVLYPRNDASNAGVGFPADFTIELSTDFPSDPGDQTSFKMMWRPVITMVNYSNPGGNAQAFNFPLQSARYVRIKATKLGGPIPAEGNKYRFQLAEVEVGNNNPYLASNGFSGTQGQNQWYYQEWTGSAYQNMTWYAADNRWQGSNNLILVGPNYQHPETYDSVRKWVAPKSGIINIIGNARMAYGYPGSDGVTASILHNSTSLWLQSIGAGNIDGYEYNLRRMVSAGDAIYFIVNKNANSLADTTIWNPEITYAPEFYFKDDFSSGSDSQWTKYAGTWAVENGEFSQSSTSGGTLASEPAVTIGDGTVKVDLHFISTSSTDNWAGISVRKTNPNDAFYQSGYLIYMRSDGKVALYKNGSVCDEVSTYFDPSLGFVGLKVELKGNQINVYVNDCQILSKIDNDFTSGYISLETNNAHVHFDNAIVTGGARFSDNFTSGSSGQWTQYAGTWAVENGEFSQSSTSGGTLASDSAITIGDGTVTTDLKIIATSGTDYWAGFSVRKANPNDAFWQSGYLIYIRPNGYLGLYRNGSSWPEVSTGVDPTAGFVNLKVELNGNQIKVYVNNVLHITQTDSDYGGGYVGLETNSAHAHYDNMTVQR